MSKKMLVTLIVLMALVLSGLILIQTRLIKTASDIQEEQFDQLVTNALKRIVAQLEIYEQRLARASAQRGVMPGNQNLPDRLSTFPRKQNVQGSVHFQFHYFQQGTNGEFQEEVQIQFTDTTGSPLLKNGLQENDSISILDQIQEYNLSMKRRREQWLRNMNWTNFKILLEERTMRERIDSAFLEEALATELRESGLELDYRYAVRSAHQGQDKFIFGSPDFNEGRKKEKYSTLLFPNDYGGQQPNYLYVFFPNRSGFLLRTTGFTIIPTIILTGLLIAIFVYVIMVIFKQKKLSMIKNDFINNMTHELKTPISTISLASQMLQDGSISNTPKTIEHVSRVINQESKRLSFQVEKVLQMAVFNEGRLKLKFKDFDVNKTIKTVVNNFELRVKNKNGELKSIIKAESPIIKGDEVHLTNVIFNLLDNAVKYSNGTPEITVSTEDRNDFIVVAVRITGLVFRKNTMPKFSIGFTGCQPEMCMT